LPLFHGTQNAQIHVVLDGGGNFQRASVVTKEDAQTIIPATEESAGRAGAKIAPHALCDNLQYVAGDYLSWGASKKKKNESGFELYITALQGWVDWSSDIKLKSVLVYLRKGKLIKDLVEHKVLFGDKAGKLAAAWDESTESPPIFKVIKQANKKGQYEAFVRFPLKYQEIDFLNFGETWIERVWGGTTRTCNKRLIYACCWEHIGTASNHPKNIRYPGDGAKLISSNDTEGFTYLGKFTSASEACGCRDSGHAKGT